MVDHIYLQLFYLKTNNFTLTWWLYLQGCQSLLFAFNTTFRKSSATQTMSVFCQPGAQCISFELRSEWLLTGTEVTRAQLTYWGGSPPPCHPPSDWLRLFSSQTFSRINTPTFSTPVILQTYPPMKMEQSAPKRRHIQLRRRGITQKKAYNIQNTAKVWNQEQGVPVHRQHNSTDIDVNYSYQKDNILRRLMVVFRQSGVIQIKYMAIALKYAWNSLMCQS
jgi:hypothetical protein